MRFMALESEIADAPREADIEPEVCEIWADNVLTWNVFLALETQWDIVAAPDGELVMTGLKYDRAEVVLRYTDGAPRRQWATILTDLRAMESAALNVLNKARTARRVRRQEELEASRTK
ncbi:MAG: DUF1799 domain-containing protein [Pseudomonadota bacterium]|nr:DUF1799 domain-containing protein [Pseudomonadota bacterium]